jgi:predicted DCC family thiol-disulfide oxidoreductase YuxK
MQADRQTCRQADRQTCRQTDRHAGRQEGRQAGRQAAEAEIVERLREMWRLFGMKPFQSERRAV